METSFVQAVKLSIMGATGLSKDALHVHIGIGAFVLAALVFRRPWRSALPLMVAVALACMGE